MALLPDKIYMITNPYELTVSVPANTVLVVSFTSSGVSQTMNNSTSDTATDFTLQLEIDSAQETLFCTVISNTTASTFLSTVINPVLHTSEYSKLKVLIDELDQVISAKIAGGGNYSITIDNKTLVSESLTQLENMRERYVKRANALWAKMNGQNVSASGKPFKSITVFQDRNWSTR